MNFLLIASIYSIVTLASANKDWWKYTTIYEILVPTFKDSNGDGIGDIKGIISKLNYLENLGIKTIYMSPIYRSDLKDSGYDVNNYYEIDLKFGNMEGFENLIQELNNRDMKLIMDYVINHSSDQHEWFQKSIQKIDPYTDYYVWENPQYYGYDEWTHPPNDWASDSGSSAWTWNEQRKQYYYHYYLPEQPDLNIRNDDVKRELKNMTKFWLDKGVAGFRMQAPMHYIEDKYLRNGKNNQVFVWETYEFIHELREFIDEYNLLHGGFERILSAEAHGSTEQVADFIGTKEYPIAHFAFNYHFEYKNYEPKAYDIENTILSQLSLLSSQERIAWVTEDHNGSRTGSRIGEAFANIFTIITALIPGIFHVYYGQEIGLLNGLVQDVQQRDNAANGYRDPFRLTMQWNDSLSSGFSSNRIPFLPVNVDYVERNVDLQMHQEISHYNLMKSLIALRETDTIKHGEFYSHIYSINIYIFWRSLINNPTIIVIINLENNSNKIDLNKIPVQSKYNWKIVTSSVNSGFTNKEYINRQYNAELEMPPQSAVVLTEQN